MLRVLHSLTVALTAALSLANASAQDRRSPQHPRSTLAVLRASEETSHLGIPYRYGGSTPEGMDCSAAVQWLFRAGGLSLPRTAEGQANHLAQRGSLWRVAAGQAESQILDQLQTGDLLFWARRSDPQRITHVMMFHRRERSGGYVLWGAQGTNFRGHHGSGVDFFSYRPSSTKRSMLVAVGKPMAELAAK